MTMDPVLFILLLGASFIAMLVTMISSNTNRQGQDGNFFLFITIIGWLAFMGSLVTEVSLAISIPLFGLYLFLVNRLSKR